MLLETTWWNSSRTRAESVLCAQPLHPAGPEEAQHEICKRSCASGKSTKWKIAHFAPCFDDCRDIHYIAPLSVKLPGSDPCYQTAGGCTCTKKHSLLLCWQLSNTKAQVTRSRLASTAVYDLRTVYDAGKSWKTSIGHMASDMTQTIICEYQPDPTSHATIYKYRVVTNFMST